MDWQEAAQIVGPPEEEAHGTCVCATVYRRGEVRSSKGLEGTDSSCFTQGTWIGIQMSGKALIPQPLSEGLVQPEEQRLETDPLLGFAVS